MRPEARRTSAYTGSTGHRRRTRDPPRGRSQTSTKPRPRTGTEPHPEIGTGPCPPRQRPRGKVGSSNAKPPPTKL
ncbi:hypothetical protein AAC387_Pa06g1139 [Persea americana]